MTGAAPAFLFPGQLSEFVGMGTDLIDSEPDARRLLASTAERCGADLERLIREGPLDELRANLPAQAGVYLVSTLAARALERRGLAPPATAGYSLGNYAAMAAAGAISFEEGLEVLIAVWRESEALAIRGGMGAIVGARREAVDEVCESLAARGKSVWIGNVNSSTQFVLTGEASAVREALETLAPRALNVLPLSMTWPIHSALMQPVSDAVAPIVASCRTIRDPRVPYYGPDGRVAATAEDVRRILATEFCHPTLWNATFEALVRDGHRAFLEVGPGDMLTKMARWIDRTAAVQPAGTLPAIDRAVERWRTG